MEIGLKCIIGELNHPNHNGRIYDSNMMKEAIENFNKEGNKMCEINPDYENFSSHNLANTVGNIEKIWVENNKIYGKVELLDTPKGKIVKECINEGCEFNLNPRMLGERVPVLDEEGNQKIDEDGNPIYDIKNVELVSFDLC